VTVLRKNLQVEDSGGREKETTGSFRVLTLRTSIMLVRLNETLSLKGILPTIERFARNDNVWTSDAKISSQKRKI
jgi:hypothetical protein